MNYFLVTPCGPYFLKDKTNPNAWNSPCSDSCMQSCFLTIISVALIAIACVATVICLYTGLLMLSLLKLSGADIPLSYFGAAFLIYSGLTFAGAGVANIIFLARKCLYKANGQPINYTPKHATIQIALSIFTPVTAFPGMFLLGLYVATRR